MEVVSGQTVASQLSTAVDNALSFISTALLIFAAIALFVGGFTIFNTLSITVGQRTRELALLRLVGAGRRQVFGSVLGEAAFTGLIASLIGLGLGVVAALGLKALLKAFGITLPAAPLVFQARTPIVAIAVGVGVTVLSAIVPARRAVRIPPVAALVRPRAQRRVAGPRDASSRGRRRRSPASAAAVAGLTEPAVALVGLGALAVFAAAGMLVPRRRGPCRARSVAPSPPLLGVPGRLGRENSMRNPLRTAQTAAALMIGLALVSTIAVLGASLSTSAADQVDSAVNADYIVTGSGGFSRSVVPAVSRLPGVTTATTVYQGQFEVRGALTSLAAATPKRLAQTVNLPRHRWQRCIGTGRGAPADRHQYRPCRPLSVGSAVSVRFAQTGAATMRIGGIYKPNPLVGSFIVGDRFFRAHFDNPLPTGVLLRTAAGARAARPGAEPRARRPTRTSASKTRAQFESDQKPRSTRSSGSSTSCSRWPSSSRSSGSSTR